MEWTQFHLDAGMDVCYRKAVGWMVATRETADLAEVLLAGTIAKENVPAKELTIHSDNGTSMASKPRPSELSVPSSWTEPTHGRSTG